MGICQIVNRIRTTLRAAVVVVGALLAAGGCSGMDPRAGFLDPTEVMRVDGYPRAVNVLTNLDTGYEEVDTRFATATDVRPGDLIYHGKDYVIGANDMLQISIIGLFIPDVETQLVRRVTDTGMISLPSIGQIKADGNTDGQLEQAIALAYRDAQILQKANVTVIVAEQRNRTYSVTGSVANPGQYGIFDRNFRLLNAINESARGVTSPTGIEYIYILRKTSEDVSDDGTTSAPTGATTQPTPDVLAPRSALPTAGPKFLQTAAQGAANAPAQVPSEGPTIRLEGQPMQIQSGQMVPATQTMPGGTSSTVDGGSQVGFEFNDLKEPSDIRVIRVPWEPLKRGELKYNIVIRPGDMIIVPEVVVGEYYMGGHVQRTGVYSLTARDITLRQAIISAGMLDQLAIPERTEIVRKVSRFKVVYARVNLAKVFAGEEPDILLKPDDQVTVGSNAIAPFLAAIRSGFRMTYGFGFLYDRNFAPTEENN